MMKTMFGFVEDAVDRPASGASNSTLIDAGARFMDRWAG
jgi:hypothetical protein